MESKSNETIETRVEYDAMGEVEVPNHVLYGAQTQRSLDYFSISTERMPLEIVKALAVLKRCAAAVNTASGLLDDELKGYIMQSCDQIIEGNLDEHFPLRCFLSFSFPFDLELLFWLQGFGKREAVHSPT